MTTLDLGLKSKSEWVEMFPFGVAIGAGYARPVMIFKDKQEKRVLPVWLSPMDAGIAVSQGNAPYSSGARNEGSPHEISSQILSTLGITLEKCLFKEVKGHHQFVELHFSSKKSLPLKMLEARADDAISFCLRSGCKFFATGDYIERSRVLEGEMVMMGTSARAEVNPHPYLN